MTIFLCLVSALVLLVAFYLGIMVGINDCKRSYGIAKGVSPAEYNQSIANLQEMAYGPWAEVE